MSTIEIILVLTGYSFIFSVIIFLYIRNKVSGVRIEKINDYMNAREKDFAEKFQSGLQEFREASINIQHDFMRFNRLRDSIEIAFKTLEKKIDEVNQLSQDMNKTSDFYEELQSTFKENNLKLQDFVTKLNSIESDFQNKEDAIKDLENSLAELKNNLSKDMLGLDENFSKRLQEAEKSITLGYDRVINLSKVNTDKLKQQYTDLEADFKDSIDILVKEEKDHLQEQIREIRSGSEVEVQALQKNLQAQEERVSALMDRYQAWEKEIADHRKVTQDRIDKFSETVLSSFKEKIDDYQKEVITLLEQRYKKLNEQTTELESRNRLKQETLDSLDAFMEESRKTVVYQMNNLSDFLEEQKEKQNILYQKNRLVLVDTYKDIKSDLVQIRDNIDFINKSREDILVDINRQLGTKLHQTMIEETPRILLEVLSEEADIDVHPERQPLIKGLEHFFHDKVKVSLKANISWIMDKLKEDPDWKVFLEEEARLKLVDKLNVDKLRKQYADLEPDFKNMVNKLVKSEENRLREELTRLKNESEQDVIRLQANLQEHENMLSKFTERYESWDRQLTDQQQNTRGMVEKFSEELLTDIEKKAESYQKEIFSQLEKKFDQIEQQASELENHAQLKQEGLENLQIFINNSKENIAKQVREKINGIDKNWNKLSEEVMEQKKFLDRMLVQGEEKLEHLIEGIKLNLADKEQVFQDTFNEIVLGMENKMASVTKRIDFFLDKTKSVDKIFQFQKEFTNSMADYQKQLGQLKKTEKRFSEFSENFQKLENESKNLQIINKNLEDKEVKITELSQQLDSIMSMTGEVHNHIETIKLQSTEIDDFLSKLQDYNQDINNIKKEFGGFKKIRDEFQEVRELVNNIHNKSQQNQEKTDLFLSRVVAGEELQKKISDNIKALDEKALSLDERYKAMEYFNKKFDNFDIAIYDLEKRVETINSLKKEIAVEQENLNIIKEGFNEQISIILKIFQNQKDKDGKLFTELDKKFKSLPTTLSHIGWSDKEIAKHLNMELYEVQLLLNRKKQKK